MSLDIRPAPHYHPDSYEPPSLASFRSPMPLQAEERINESLPTDNSFREPRRPKRPFIMGFLACMIFLLLVWGGISLKNILISHGERGAASLEAGLKAFQANDIPEAQSQFERARQEFQTGESWFTGWGVLLEPLRSVPIFKKVVAGKAILESGSHFARAGLEMSIMSRLLSEKFTAESTEKETLLAILKQSQSHVENAYEELDQAQKALAHVDPSDLPLAKQDKFKELQENLPTIVASLNLYLSHSSLFEEFLGGNGPRKYLFLFQNNNELRATGGFIGTYALLDVANGDIRRFFVDGIFNPDGQLKENIVPPKPIQKISAAWSLHDSNWFPDFPTSAEKAAFFYEKTGGPTVDGVITFTPVIMKRLLALTGPIELSDYGVTIDTENFIPIIQEQVEEKYDRTENNPKKILSDLTDVLIERLLAFKDREHLQKLGETLVTALNERHILLYARHAQTEKLIDAAGWSGRILETPHDYLAVIHSNINGYKTDGVVSENIEHVSRIENDGSIIDTVTVTRRHNGGNTPYEWWNKVNADYMRVYVPEGSELLSAEGMTRETDKEPLDYNALGFKRDALIEEEEKNEKIDPESGTRISKESGKTVFGNWVYVSPQESVTVKYEYRLPERLPLDRLQLGSVFGYSVLYQKQSGTEGVTLQGQIEAPDDFDSVWQTGRNLVRYGRAYQLKASLDQNQFLGVVFKKH